GCYEGFARARSGMNLRTEMHWGRVLGEAKTIYAAGDPAEAYAIVEHDWEFWQEQPIVEFGWTSPRGYRSILSFFGSLGINKSVVAWHEPSDGPFLGRYLDQGVKIESEKPIMYRLVNLPAALEQLDSSGSGEFSIAVHDPDLPENSGPWKVRFEGGGTRVSQVDDAAISLDARSAVQALLGQPSLDDLIRNGVVDDSEDARRLLPPSPTFCIDHF
ncbi:MAG TPA: sterol carrier protein domain-containing protein, partial [Fimbriimonadaceae bacterium]|nr:sterol carrier protein domain-containing protein [Fimbriimonadaceae bacterium]